MSQVVPLIVLILTLLIPFALILPALLELAFGVNFNKEEEYVPPGERAPEDGSSTG